MNALLAALAEKPKELKAQGRPKGEARKPEPKADLFEKPVMDRFKYSSTNTDYLTARIARDHPEIHARLKAGGYSSVRQAALAERPKELAKHGAQENRGNRHAKAKSVESLPCKLSKDLFSNPPNLISQPKGGNSTDYLTARIARDHPEIHERLKAQGGDRKSTLSDKVEGGWSAKSEECEECEGIFGSQKKGVPTEFLAAIKSANGTFFGNHKKRVSSNQKNERLVR